MSSRHALEFAPHVYRQLGVRTWINAAGTYTHMGGSLMPPEVVAAWQDAAGHFVDLHELQESVGRRLAALLNVEAALVTAGAASALTLGTAAAITRRDPQWPLRANLEAEPRWEVVAPRSPDSPYHRQIVACGVRLVEADSLEAARSAIGERTVLLFASNVHLPARDIDHEAWIALGRAHDVPLLLDAAADAPPVGNLSRFCQLGYDLAAISGGKAIRGPQDAGLLLGRADLIEAAHRNASPHEGTIGRAMKVSKEDMVALWTAVCLFHAEGDAIFSRCDAQLQIIQRQLATVPAVSLTRVVPPVANRFPHLIVQWDESAWPISVADVRAALRQGDPPIATEQPAGVDEPGLYIAPINLRTGEETIVARRIREALMSRTA